MSEIPKTPGGQILLKEKEGYELTIEDGVYRCLTPDFRNQLDHYLKCFEEFNGEYLETSISKELLSDLPHSVDSRFWQVRKKDLEFISEKLSDNSEVLEIGSWNGWLANSLSGLGHSVTAIDYFLDDLDGLKTRNHYPDPKWTSLNMDVEDVDLIEAKFDLVVFNRSLSYYSNFDDLLEKIKQIVKVDGVIILTGVNVVFDADGANAFYERSDEIFRERYGISLEIKPNSKKMFVQNDLEILEKMGFQLISEDKPLQRWVKKAILPKRSRSYTAIYEHR